MKKDSMPGCARPVQVKAKLATAKTFAQIDTPSLLLDLTALEANIQRLASFFSDRHIKLRPHFKSHKCTAIARMQINAGAIGITCAKLGEAEVLADAGIRDLLIANEIIGPIKIKRLIALGKRADPMVAVDSAANVKMLSEMAAAAKVKIRVLVEINVGMNRCGVAPGSEALKLARLVAGSPGLKFEGLQGYEGHCVDSRDANERREKTRFAIRALVDSKELIKRSGLPVNIVSGGGTGTYLIHAEQAGLDELQAGSYALMDWYYADICPEFQQAMSILTTVVSRTQPELAIIDVGRKGIGAEWGPPKIKNFPGATVAKYSSEEHMILTVPRDSKIKVGDRIEIIPSHGCTTSNLYSEFVVHQHGAVKGFWPIEGRGKLQ